MPGRDKQPQWHRRPDERPAEILKAAREVFGRHGLAGARLEEVAERAGISKGTIYLYFENKDALFRAVVRETVAPLESLLRAERPGSASERLERLARDAWTYLRTPAFQSVYRLVLGELDRFPDLARYYAEQFSGKVSAGLARIVREGVASGEFRPQDPVLSARMLVASLLTHSVWCERRILFPRLGTATDAEVGEQVLGFYMKAILAAPADGGAGRSGTMRQEKTS